MLTLQQRPAFFAVRISLGVISSLCETTLYRTVLEDVKHRVGRYLFFMLLFSAGMWTASTGALSRMCLNMMALTSCRSFPSLFVCYVCYHTCVCLVLEAVENQGLEEDTLYYTRLRDGRDCWLAICSRGRDPIRIRRAVCLWL